MSLAALLLPAGAALAVWLAFPTHWRVLAVEQAILTPWLRPAYLGDGGSAAELLLCYPMGLAINREGEVLISDRGRGRRGRVVWRIDSQAVAHIVAGTGRRGDGRADRALQLDLERPEGLAAAPNGDVFLSDGFNHSVYRIEPNGRVQRAAGTGTAGFSGDGGPAARAMLFRPADIRLDQAGNLFIADVRNHRIRKVDSSGRITTIAGTGEAGFSADGTPAHAARLDTPWGIALDLQGRLLIADSANHRVRRVERDGRLTTVAGSGRQGFDGDGGPATQASLNFPEGLFVDSNGSLFIGDEHNHAVRMVDTAGTISTVLGTGTPGRATLGTDARDAAVDDPENVLVTPDGVIVTDGNNGRVIRIAADGRVRLVAGRSDTRGCAPRW